MECNRDEALRAREIAERKFLARDLKGAKKFALKAQNLYPELEGISQMVRTLEVYISAEEKMNGESNWYGVIGLAPLADDDAIRKQYRKLALLLHPDKNRSIGAEGAFQFISQAWNLLSDKSKKTAYDQRCGRLFQQRNQTKNEGPSPPTQNGFYSFANTAASQMKTQKGNTNNGSSSAVPRPPRKKHRSTFWTVCHRCKMQYEYLRNYLNHNLLCPNCHEAYFAVEIDPPSTSIKIPSQTSNSQHNNFQWVPFSESSGAQSAVQAANMVQQAYEKVKRERQKAQAAARREEALRRKNIASKRTIFGESSGNSEASKQRKGAEDCGLNKDKIKHVNRGSGSIHQVNNSSLKHDSFQKCVRRVDMKHIVMEKAREEIHRKLNECISATVESKVASENSHINKKEDEVSTKNDSLVTHGFMCKRNNLGESLEADKIPPPNELGFGPSDTCSDDKLAEKMCVNVLESDFHDFDKSRTDRCFAVNQVWAVYDDDGGMPRHYAMIQDVISLNPFKVNISLLSSITHSRLGSGSWFLSGFLRTYGEFAVGRHEICSSINCFSHKVRWRKRSSKTILICPRKGDVWALYRNWSPEWNELTEHGVMHKYDIVEVLEDCDEELGVIVIPLVKVAGFKTVFHQHTDPGEIRRIPKEELSRFSHQVPSHMLNGQEGLNSPKGCLELDPAAIPSEFLQLMSDIETVEFMVADEDIEIVKAVDGDGIMKPVMVEDS